MMPCIRRWSSYRPSNLLQVLRDNASDKTEQEKERAGGGDLQWQGESKEWKGKML